MNVLNPNLYQALRRQFGVVAISDQNASFVSQPSTYQDSRGCRPSTHVLSPGEYYRVNCPFCNDQRQRLYINHKFGVVDPETSDDHIWLAHCFNEECVKDRATQRRLHDMIFPFGYRAFAKTAQNSANITAHKLPL